MANAVLGAVPYPSLHDTFDGSLLAGGEVLFFEEDEVTPKNVYTDPFRNDPKTQITLDSVGQFPPTYYDEDTYYIEIYRAPEPGCPCLQDTPLYTFFYYPGVTETSTSEFAENFISNGQFSYPLSFNVPGQTVGEINAVHTFLAQGWEFNTNDPHNDDIFISFVPLFDNSTVPSNPQNYFNIRVTNTASSMSSLDLYQTVGYVNILQGREITFSLYGFSTISTEQLEVLVQNIYDDNTQTFTSVGTLELTSTPSNESLTFTFPSVTSNPINTVNNSSNLIIRFPLNTVIDISITNIQIELGSISDPSYIESPRDEVSSRAFFNHFIFPDDPTSFIGESAYSRLTYINNQFSWEVRTGQCDIVFSNAAPSDAILCDGQILNINGYSDSGIPYNRLYDVIGNTFGGNSDSVIAVANDEIVTITSPIPGDENSNFTAGTLSSVISVVKTKKSYLLDTEASQLSSEPSSITFSNKTGGSMNENPAVPGLCFTAAYGYWFGIFSSPTLSVVQPTYNDPDTTTYKFVSSNPYDYQTSYYTTTEPVSFFEFSSLDPFDDTRADYRGSSTTPPVPPSYNVIRISVDGAFGSDVSRLQGVVTLDVDFSSHVSLIANLDKFIKAVNNPFEYKLTINLSLTGSAGDYFLYSSTVSNYYGWIRVDGGGTDPLVPGRTGVVIDIDSSDNIDVQADKLASAISTSTFALPSIGDFPTIPNANFSYAIYL